MAKHLYVVTAPASGEVFGSTEDKASAEKLAREQGPGVIVIPAEQGADGKWGLRSSSAKVAAVCQCPDCPNSDDWGDKGSESVKAERLRILGLMAAMGVSGLAMQAARDGLTPDQAQGLFQGKTETEIFGPAGRPAAASNEGAWMAEWARSPALQAEFGGNLKGFLLYKRAEDEGRITICGGGRIQGQ